MPKNNKTIPATLIPGDGIGPEIVKATTQVLDELEAPFEWEVHQAGMAAQEATGNPIPQATVESVKRTKLALKGPLTTPVGGGFRSINVKLREVFQLFANVRPAKTLLPDTPFGDFDIVLIRENTQGFYVGVEHYIQIGDDPKAVAEATGIITREGCRRIAEFAFDYAVRNGRKKITIVHKANILKALTGLFLETAEQVGEKYEGRIEVEERIVDACAMHLVINPGQFDVILTTNLFGDILSDEIAGLVGSLGLAPGANVGANCALFEAVHGSAPDIAGQGIANPAALMLAAAMMLDHVDEEAKAGQLRAAMDRMLREDKLYTGDLGGKLTTAQFADELIKRL